jgi:intergrase/recombinase
MKSFQEFLTEERFKFGKHFMQIDGILDHADAKSKKYYISKLNTFDKDQLNDVENSIEAETDNYLKATHNTNKYVEKEELDIGLNAMDAAIDQIVN